jgi:F-type H+-transporting ATPase subunit c
MTLNIGLKKFNIFFNKHTITTWRTSSMGDLATAFAYFAAGIGAGIVTIGAGIGIGKIASSAMDGTARQPEATNEIRTTMIIAAALIEGVALIGAVACLLLSFK